MHVPPQADIITQLRRKVHDSTVRNDKLTQLVAELKNEVRDLKTMPRNLIQLTPNLLQISKSKYCELARDKQRDKQSVNNVSLCHQLINCLC